MYTAIYRDDNDYMEIKHLNSSKELSEFVAEIVESKDLDTESHHFKRDLSEFLLLFDGELKARPISAKQIVTLDINIEEPSSKPGYEWRI